MKSHEIERAKPELAIRVSFFRASSQGFELRLPVYFRVFFYRMEAYMENYEDSLLMEGEEGTPESGKNSAPHSVMS